MVKGKCNCGKNVTTEYLVQDKGTSWTIKLCDSCKPKLENKYLTLIDGNN